MLIGVEMIRNRNFYISLFRKITECQDFSAAALVYNRLVIIESDQKDPFISFEKIGKLARIFYDSLPFEDKSYVDFVIRLKSREVFIQKFAQESDGTPYFLIVTMQPNAIHFRRKIVAIASEIKKFFSQK